MKEEIIDVVDDKDNVVGKSAREEILTKRLIHRAAMVIVFNSKGRIYVHQRSHKKRTFPRLWAIGAGGALQVGESYDDAAKRELMEELGIENVNLEFIFDFNYRCEENKYNAKIYKCVYDGKIKINEEEFEQGMFINFKDMEKFMQEHQFCPDTAEFFERYKKLRK